jgi:hypothetical protein
MQECYRHFLADRASWRVTCDARWARLASLASYPTMESSVTPHRTFNDDAARLWNAWDVVPSWGERRYQERRAEPGLPLAALRERRRLERRRRPGIRIALPPRLAHGWIAFECGEERRRIAPIPPGWEHLSEAELRELWGQAEQLPPRRKRFVE